MPAYTPEKACSTFSWLCCFIACVFISVHPLNDDIPAKCSNIVEVETPPDPPDDSSAHNRCPGHKYTVQVGDEEFPAYFCVYMDMCNCSQLMKESQRDADPNCWINRKEQDYYCFSSSDAIDNISNAAFSFKIITFITTLMSVVFGILVLFSFSSIFKPEIIRFCPPWLLTFAANISSRIRRYRPQSQPPPQVDTMPGLQMPQPPRSVALASRRKVKRLVESTKLSDQEARALEDEGWSCCICLGEHWGEDGKLASVSRLQCSHAIHSECLQSWLEKGRAVCPLCNTDVFQSDTKPDGSVSSSGPVHGTERADSLDVERTEGALSSPGNSMRIDMSQHRPNAPSRSVPPWEHMYTPSR